jgi:hypothetical protein
VGERKYKNQRAISEDGHTFASRREARRYRDLKLLEEAGEISRLTLQPRFPLHCCGKPVLYQPSGRHAVYVADFSYRLSDHTLVVEDVKGKDTPLSKLKRAVLLAEEGIDVVLI